MEAKECTVQEILTENKKYIIPSYQRPYTWESENAIQLIDDIYQSIGCEEQEYFIGSLICINQKPNHYEVVDGQQRLITLSIIISELRKLIQEERIQEELKKRILPIDVYDNGLEQPRIQVRKKEEGLYHYFILQDRKDFLPQNPTDTELAYINNAEEIRNYLVSIPVCQLKQLARFILENVYIVFVQTDNLASSFRLFNVLNNRGIPLNNADLLKNALFEAAMDKDKLTIVRIESVWSKIEGLVGVKNMDRFLYLHKISEKKARHLGTEINFEIFINDLRQKFNNDVIAFSGVLVHSAKNYARIIDNDFDRPSIQRKIYSLNNLKVVDEWLPIIMAFLNRMERNNEFSMEQFDQFITIFEKIYMHAWFKKQTKQKRIRVSYSALIAINTNQSFNDIIAAIKVDADNDGFLAALDQDLYESRSNLTSLIRTIFRRLDIEQYHQSVTKTYNGRTAIEHILPSTIDKNNLYWCERFTPSSHQEWVHKLGNLTVISGEKNPQLQRADFHHKKIDYEKRNQRSSFDISKDICQLEDWTLEELKKRHESLKEQLKKLWLV